MSGGSVGLTILTGGAGQAAGSLVGPGVEAGKGIYHYLKRKYTYIKNLDRNFVLLDREFAYISSRQIDVRDKIARNQVMMEATRECDTWLKDVGRMLESVEKLKIRYQQAISNPSCIPCLSNTRLKLSKEIVKMTNIVVELRDRMDIDRVVLVQRRPNKVEMKFPRNINEVPSLYEHVETLLELLQDDNMKRIGIWGMSGVGKTTILENLNDAVEKLHIFDIVLWVTVSKKDSPHEIQQEILRRLGVNVESIETQKQAESLISRLLENTRYLLLLDEVSSEFDLRHIGIHHTHEHGKVVLAAKEKKICNSMETDEEVKVERLSREDARKLFRCVAGEAADHPNIKPIAERVLKQCGELPYIIRAMGNFLKGKFSEDFWTDTLSKLQSPNVYQLQQLEDVFNSFKVIFDELHDTLKNCLLYTASFPEEHEIYRDYLIECWRAEQLIGINETFRKTREEGHTNLDNLIDKCLFDRSRSSNSVRMPIIFRNSALKIANQRKYGLLLRSSEELENLPDEKWTNANVISLMNSNLLHLPSSPDCSVLSTLFLQKNVNLSLVPPSFFDYMSTLRILDLSDTNIKFLPASVSKLTNLKGLYVNNCCKLVHLPQEIEQLQNLELFDIRCTGIHGLPAAIGGLISLRCLRVSYTTVVSNGNSNGGIEVTPSETIQWLEHLEELTIDVNPKDTKWKMIAPKFVEEVAKLEKLSTLSFWFPTTGSLETFIETSKSWRHSSSLPGKNLRSFNFAVGSLGSTKLSRLDVSRCTAQRYFRYCNCSDIPNGIKGVLKRTCALELIGHENITDLSDFGIYGMECLEMCKVEKCDAMTTVLGSQISATPAFPWLTDLHLLNLQQLYAICVGPVTRGSFGKLTTLTLYECPSMTEVFSSELTEELNELQHLSVEKCAQVRQIFAADNRFTQPTVIRAFPKLKTLKLVTLESLFRIHSDDSFKFLELQSLEIIHCDRLVNLCSSAINVPKLRRIQCNAAWWQTVVFSDYEAKANLERLCFFS